MNVVGYLRKLEKCFKFICFVFAAFQLASEDNSDIYFSMDFQFFIPDVHRRAFDVLGLGDAFDVDVIDLSSSDDEVLEGEPVMPPLEVDSGGRAGYATS